MNLLISIFIIFTIHQVSTSKLSDIDVLEKLKSKHASCDLRNFVQATDNSDDEYKMFIHDLTKYCSTSKSITLYNLLCHMILIELEIGCELSNNSRPFPVKYSMLLTSSEICSMNKIDLINNWIWQKLTTDEKEEIGPTPSYLCRVLTSSNSTTRLARFFYKIAPRIRRADLRTNGQLEKKKDLGNSVFNKIQVVGDISLKQTNQTKGALFEQDELSVIRKNKTSEVVNQTDENTGKKINSALDVKQEQIASNATKTSSNRNLIIPVDREVKKPYGRDPDPVDLKKADGNEINPPNELQKEEGLPLGRVGENPEREQINERPKPKELDVEVVFKANDDEEKNWIEGKHNADQPENRLQTNFKRSHRSKSDNSPFKFPQLLKRKSSLKLKLNEHLDNDDDHHSLTSYITTILLIFILCIIIIYLILRNKNKMLGLVVEGCKRRKAVYNRRIRLSQSN